MRVRRLGGLAALAVGGALAFGNAAHAASVTSILAAQLGNNAAIDISFETIVGGDGDNLLEVGESLRGIFTIHNINATVLPDGQWTGIFQTQVTTATAVGGGVFDFTFGPDAGFAEATAVGATGAMVLMYEDLTPDWTNGDGPTQAADEAEVLNGDLYWAIGMNGTIAAGDTESTLDEFWWARGFQDITTAAGSLATADFGLNRVTTVAPATGDLVILTPQITFEGPAAGSATYDFTGTATANRNGDFPATSPWPVADTTSINFVVADVVPLPAAVWSGMALMGLLGAGRTIRRRRNQSAVA